MTIRPVRCLGALGLPALISTLTWSCSTSPAPGLHKPVAAPQVARETHSRIAQFGYGELAHYATCRQSACPGITPKTLAFESPVAAIAPVPDPSAPISHQEPALITIHAQAAARASDQDPAAEPPARQVTLHFAFGSAALTPAARAQIDAAIAARPTAGRISISGRTDSMGPAEVNDALALARANAVHDSLLSHHPQLTSSIKLVAKGSCCYVAPNDTPRGRARNRRVEIVLDASTADP